MTINFTVPAGDGDKILEIAGKATPPGGDPFMTVLDLTVCHANGCPLDLEEQNSILFEGGYPIYAQLCKEKEMPYPQLGPAGEILADEAWWLGRPTKVPAGARVFTPGAPLG